MKKLMAMVLALLLVLVGCGPSANEVAQQKTESPSASEEETEQKNEQTVEGQDKTDGPIRVCVIYVGNLGDKSYNDSSNMGATKAAQDFKIELKNLEGVTAQDWEANVVAASEEGYDLIIGSASNIADYIEKHAPDYPDTKYAVIDTTVDLPNVQSISFAQNEGSFLAGAAAAMFTEHTEIDGVNSDPIIGWVGGIDIPVLQDFFVGYEQGAKYINPDIQILRSFAGNFQDPLKGKELTLAQYQQGADIVMNVASGTGQGILEAAKEAGKYAIGVDLDQDNVQPGSVLTSMVKKVDTAVYLTIESIVNGTFEGGSTKYLTLADGGVSLTDFSVMKEHLGDKFPQDIVDKTNELAEKIKSGEIKVDNYEGFGQSK